MEVYGCSCGDYVVPPTVDEPGVRERGEGIQGRDRVADATYNQLQWPEPLLLAFEQEPQDEELHALGCLRQMVGLVRHSHGYPARPTRASYRR